MRRRRGPNSARRRRLRALAKLLALVLLLAPCLYVALKTRPTVRGNPVELASMDQTARADDDGFGGSRVDLTVEIEGAVAATVGNDTAEEEASAAVQQEAEPNPQRRQIADVFQECLPAKIAEERGQYLIRSSRPKGISAKEFQSVERCWRRRRRSEPLYPASDLPPLGDIGVRLSDGEVSDLVFVHGQNLGRLGQAIRGGEGKTLTDLVQEAGQFTGLPANATEALGGQRRRDCAVVASGGSLLNQNLGKEIDSHEVVIRINQAPTAKTSVGARTTIRLVNNLWTQTYAKANLAARRARSGTPLEQNATMYITRPRAEDYLKLVRRLSSQQRNDVGVRLVSSRVVSIVRDRILGPYRDLMERRGEDELTAALLEGRDTPSSGLVAVILMIQLCQEVTAYGFSGINDGRSYRE